MAILAFGFAGAAMGGALLGTTPLLFGMSGASIGWALGSFVGGQLMQKDVRLSQEGPRLTDLRIQASTYGQAIAKVYGRARIAGELIWSSGIIEVAQSDTQSQGGGGKGGGPETSVTTTTYSYYAHLAVGICEGTIGGIRKIWANGTLIYNVGDDADVATIFASNAHAEGFRFNLGSATQAPDPLLESYEGAGNVPAYRNLAYVVLDRFQLAAFGNRIPNFEFEVVDALSPTLIGGPVADGRQADNTGVTVVVGDSHSLTGNGNSLWSNNRIDANGVYETGTVGYTGTTARAMADRNANGVYMGKATYDIPLSFSPATAGWARGPSYCNADTRCAVVTNNSSPWRWWFLDFEARVAPEISLSALPGGSTGVVSACAKNGHHLYTTVVEGVGSYRWYYTDLSALVPTAVRLHAAAAQDLPAATEDAWYVVSTSTIKTYTHGTSTELASVAYSGVTNTGFARVEGGFLVEARPHLIFVDDAGTSTQLGTVAPQFASSFVYGAYGNGAWVSPETSGTARFHEDQWYGVALTAGAAPALSTVVQHLCTSGGLSASDLNVTALTASVTGYVRGRRMPIRASLEPLMIAYMFDAVESDGKIKFVLRGGASAATLTASDLAARQADDGKPPAPITHIRGQDLELPSEIAATFMNDNFGYQQGAQYARRLTTSAVGRGTIELPVVLTDAQAKAIVDASLFDAWAVRDRFIFATTRKYAKYEPGDVLTVPFGATNIELRIEKRDDGANGVIGWEGVYTDASVYTQNASTQSAPTPDGTLSVPGPTDVELMDVPLLRDVDDAYGIYAAVCGYLDGWRGALLYRSADGGGSYEALEDAVFLTEATIGLAETALGSVTFYDRFDEANTVDVAMRSGTLSSVTRDQVLNGANAALLGSEIIQFRDATLLAAGRYRLSGLLRGRLGTDRNVGTHAIDDRFVLLSSSTVRFIPQASVDVGVERQFKAVSIGNTLPSAESEALTYTASNIKPLSPVHVGGGRDASGNLTVQWKRRTRLNAVWRDYVDAPLGETSESYEIDVMNGSTVVRTLTSSTTTASYTAAQQTTDFGSPQASVSVRVYQLSSRAGRGYVATATV